MAACLLFVCCGGQQRRARVHSPLVARRSIDECVVFDLFSTVTTVAAALNMVEERKRERERERERE